MRRLRHIAVWVLLGTFVAGGTLGPSLHRVQHASSRAAMEGQPCHSPAVHNTAVPLWTALEDLPQGPECDLCATRHLVFLPALTAPTEPALSETIRVEALSHLTLVETATDRFIRGPPRVLGGRLA